uniref:Uncharacterized protein LOC105057342 isoform X2 n=1 Tax=Elaeis guineensis var. tenera TaxID=51953 RepID=A0A6I9S687_ELAGV|nr:uncharacterized protein LOC105057342 isoform X2 [Elaeis guineensis]
MEGFGVFGSSFAKKRRSATSRRRRLDPQFTLQARDAKLSPDESAGSARRIASSNKIEGLAALKKLKKDDDEFGDLEGLYRDCSSSGGLSGNSDHRRSGSELKRCSEGALAPANWKGASNVKDNSKIPSRSSDGNCGKSGDGNNVGQSIGTVNGSADNKLKKVKLTVGGVTRTIHAKSNLANEKSGLSSVKPSCSSDASWRRQKLILQDTSDDDYPPPEQGNGLQGASQKDFGGVIFHGAKDNSGAEAGEESLSGKQTDMPQSTPFSEPVCKSKRVPKRRALDGESDDGNEADDEIRYLERLKSSKASPDYSGEHEDDGEEIVKNKKVSKVSKSRKSAYDVDEDYGLSRSNKDSRRKSRTVRKSDDTDYVEDEEPGSDDGPDAKRQKQKREPVDSPIVARSEPLTTRQRARQSGAGESLIEFPNGLPASTPRTQKKQLSEMEQQARKAEAAQKRRMQVEKAARESEAEAIRKILGQDSNRKKKEEKIRKEREEMAQKAAESLILPSNSIRWVMGPSGTVVTFGDDVGLPSIFDSKQCSYPPPREKCAAPSCTNAYKYRDSKSNLPLCSLQCYKAIKERAQPVSTC